MRRFVLNPVLAIILIAVLGLAFRLTAAEEKKADEKAAVEEKKASTEPSKEIPEKKEPTVLATVNGIPIKSDEIELLYDHLGGKMPRSFILEQLIQKKAVEQYLDKENVKVEEKAVDEEIAKIKMVYEKQKINLDEKMKEQGISPDEFRKEIKFQVRLRDYLSNKATDKEIIDGLSRVRASHILVATSADRNDAEAKKKIEEIQAELLKAEKLSDAFGEAAGKYSDCPSKAKGGDLGFFAKGQMVKEFSDIAFALEVGQMSPPVKTKFGYHLILVTERKPFAKDAYEKDKEKLRAQYIQMMTMPFVTEISEKAKVERFDTDASVKEGTEKKPEQEPEKKPEDKGSGDVKEPVKENDKAGAGGEK